MKVRGPLLTENNAPVSKLGENPEKKALRAWEAVAALLNAAGEDTIVVERVEIVPEEG